jgi:DNA-binding response OmpR family regulator
VIRVLHVDDEAPIRLLVRVNLEWEGGIEVIEAVDGWTGVQLAQCEQPDVILLNVNLHPGAVPRGGSHDPAWFDGTKPVGWLVAEELGKGEETREIPIVFLTARSELRDRLRGFELGAVDYILKPFNPTEVAPRLRRVMELERGEREELRREKISELRARMKAGQRRTRLPE